MSRSPGEVNDRAHLSDGEAVQNYVRQVLPTIDDRIKAYQCAAQNTEEESLHQQVNHDALVRHDARLEMVWYIVVTGSALSGVLIAVLFMIRNAKGDFAIDGAAWLYIVGIVFVSFMVAWIKNMDHPENEVQLRRRQRESRRSFRASDADRDLSLLRTGWVPGTVEGLARLGINAERVDLPQGRSRAAGTRYQEYLRSPHWRMVREAALQRAGHRCQLDASHTMNLQVHHNTYVRLGEELPEDLIVLCDDCHRRYHEGGRMPGRT